MEQAHRGWDKKRKDAKRNTIVQSSVSLDEHVAVQWENKVRTLLASRLYLKIICQILSLVMMQGISGWQSRLKKKAVNKGYDRFQKIMSQLNQVRQEPDNVDINLNYGVKVVASSHSFCLSLKILLCSKPIIMRSAAYSSIEFIRFWHKRKKEWEVKFERTLASFESGMESSELKNICLLLRPVEKEDKPLYSRFVKAGRPCILDSSLKDPDKDIPTVLISRTLPAFWDVERNSYWLVLGDPSTDNDIGIVDSGCSRSMTGNKEKLDDFVQIKGGIVKFGGGDGRISGKGTIRTSKLDFENVYYVEELQHFNLFSVSQICDKKNKVLFTDTDCLVLSEEFQLPDASQVVLRIPRKHDLYTFHISDLQPEQKVTCLVAKASLDESTRWHRRMAHVNFKTINKLAKEGLVDGLPLKVFTNEHNCVACNKGKQHRVSYKHISAVRLITDTLQLLHMDLFGPTNIRSIDQKYYSLVVTDDFSRFSWTFFLGTKDETFYVLKEFITLIENQLNKKVKGIRCDNGTEFKNAKLIELCGEKGIKRDYSNPRTPQQNGVAERKNRTLIEAARTMLADSKLPTMFWTEAVSTACYVLNRVSITNPHNKTPYELISGKVPQIKIESADYVSAGHVLVPADRDRIC
ncbi:putative ribonuclease H-like domain-containing protein [Tanacetum coccineum]